MNFPILCRDGHYRWFHAAKCRLCDDGAVWLRWPDGCPLLLTGRAAEQMRRAIEQHGGRFDPDEWEGDKSEAATTTGAATP